MDSGEGKNWRVGGARSGGGDQAVGDGRVGGCCGGGGEVVCCGGGGVDGVWTGCGVSCQAGYRRGRIGWKRRLGGSEGVGIFEPGVRLLRWFNEKRG